MELTKNPNCLELLKGFMKTGRPKKVMDRQNKPYFVYSDKINIPTCYAFQ